MSLQLVQRRGRLGRSLLAAAFVAFCWAARLTSAWPSIDDQSPEAQLARLLVAQGAELPGFALGQPCPRCPRGVVASKDLEAGDLVMRLPNTAILYLRDLGYPAFPAEYARGLLVRMHTDPAHNATWGAYWATQPGPDEVFTPEVFTDEHLAMLQCPELSDMASQQRDVTAQVYDGSYPFASYSPLTDTLPHVSLETFKYVAALLASRYFGAVEDWEGDAADRPARQLEPFVELFNHGDTPNAQRLGEGSSVVVRALRAIQAGEDIVHMYQTGLLHRPDMSLYLYGFVVPQERPLLASVDLPSFDRSEPFTETALDDSAYEAGGELATRQEYDWLAARLASLPTTEAEDQAQLDGGADLDWRQRALLQFRVMRKRALRQTLERLAAVLGEPGMSPAAAPGEEEAAAPEAAAEARPPRPAAVKAPAAAQEEEQARRWDREEEDEDGGGERDEL